MIYSSIKTPKTYIGKDGQEKTTWLEVGTLRETENGKKFIELNFVPDRTFVVFEPRPKEETELTSGHVEDFSQEIGDQIPF